MGKTGGAGREESLLENLVSVEVLQSKIELCRIDECVHRCESYYFATHHRDTVSVGEQFDQFIRLEELALVIVGHVHRDLDYPSLLQFEAERLDVGESSI